MKVIDNFYEHPDEMRSMAINAKYELISSGNYMGRDSFNRMVMTPELNSKLRILFPGEYYKIMRSRFRTAIDGDTYMSFVHSDCVGVDQGWHVLISLSKEPGEDGLVMYEHEKYGRTCEEEGDHLRKDTSNFEKFKPWKVQNYKYNSAVVVDYGYFHAPLCKTGTGNCIENSRLLHIIEVVDTRTPHYKHRVAMEGTSVSPYKKPCGRNGDD
jgi:hypothetical protein